MIHIDQIREAQRVLARYLPRTPLVPCPALDGMLGARTFLKLETCSPVGSFKGRGALFAISAWRAKSSTGPLSWPHIVTASSGNHGLAVAYAARLLGVKATVYVPEGAAESKVAAIRRQGATLIQRGRDFDEAKAHARADAEEIKGWWLEDGEEPNIAAGAGTIGVEILRDLPHVGEIIVPVGNGALIGGIGSAVRSLDDSVVVTGVQPEQALAMVRSFEARKPVRTESCRTIADGLASREPVPQAVELMLEVVDTMITVSEAAIVSALRVLFEEAHVLVEPAAATALAGALQRRDHLQGKNVVLVITGANIDTQVLLKCLSGV